MPFLDVLVQIHEDGKINTDFYLLSTTRTMECCNCSRELNCPRRVQLVHLIRDEASHTIRDTSEVLHALSWRCYPHTRNGVLRRCLSKSQSLLVGLSIQDEIKGSARPVTGGGGSLFASITGNKEGTQSWWYSGLCPHQLGSQPRFFTLLLVARPCIPYPVCDAQKGQGVVVTEMELL